MIFEHKQSNINSVPTLFSQLWFKYFPYWPVIVSLIIICLGVSWFYLRSQVPVFESNATILVKDEMKGLDDSKVIESLNQLATNKIIENEIEVIKSRSLMTEVIRNLHLYAPVFEEGHLVTRSAYKTSPIEIISDHPDSLAESGKVYFTVNESNMVIVDGHFYPMDRWVQTELGVLKFIRNIHSQGSSTNRPLFFTLNRPETIVNGFLAGLTVSPVNKLSTLLRLKYNDPVPSRGNNILNEMIVAYNKAALDDKNTLAANTLAFVEERLSFVDRELDSIEYKLQLYKSNKGAIDISAQGQLFLDNVSTNDQQLSTVTTQLDVLENIENYVVSKASGGGLVPSTLGINDPLLSQLLDRLYSAELQYEKLKATTGENNNILVSLADQIQIMKPGILENIRSQKKSLQLSKRNVLETNSLYTSKLRSIPQKERDLVEISREQSIKSNIYTFLLQKREETALSYSSAVTNTRIIDKAQASSQPVSPNKKRTYMLAIVFGFGMSIGLISLKDLLNNKILFRSEIENFMSFPIIAEIIQEKSGNPIVVNEGSKTLINQQFRKIHASLNSLGLQGDKKKILVTSSIQQDGKSFVAANLGLALAIAGKRVVIVEINLETSSLSKTMFGLSSKPGIQAYLKNEVEIDAVIENTGKHQNLFVVPSGASADGALELVLSDKINILLKILESRFDFIIIDSAPVNLVPDAYFLSPLCDATLFVIRHDHTPKILVQRFDEMNRVNELKNVGIVFNGIRSRGFNEGNYGYGHVYNQKASKS